MLGPGAGADACEHWGTGRGGVASAASGTRRVGAATGAVQAQGRWSRTVPTCLGTGTEKCWVTGSPQGALLTEGLHLNTVRIKDRLRS